MKGNKLEREIIRVLEGELLSHDIVLDACEQLSKKLEQRQLWEAAHLISREVLSARVSMELGGEMPCRYPLGVLFHIGAGNVPGLGAYSVLEGLLTGNINILKPSSEDMVSSFILRELVRLEPRLRSYLYVFSFSSRDTRRLKRLISIADAVVLWGGDQAVSALRSLMPPEKRLIEWGHKFSFVYVTKQGLKMEEKIAGLAYHLEATRQRLCSSCQTIYIDTEDSGVVKEFTGKLEEAINRIYLDADSLATLRASARNTLINQSCALSAAIHGRGEIYTGGCPVECLPRERALGVLRKTPVSLQTVGLICEEREREELSRLFYRAGAVRIRPPKEMSRHMPEGAHDGEYPLLRYTKIVE